MVVFLNPMKAPSQTFGTDKALYIKRRTTIVGKGTAAEDYSIQLLKFIIKNIANKKLG